jgi:hypothetical protein
VRNALGLTFLSLAVGGCGGEMVEVVAEPAPQAGLPAPSTLPAAAMTGAAEHVCGGFSGRGCPRGFRCRLRSPDGLDQMGTCVRGLAELGDAGVR